MSGRSLLLRGGVGFARYGVLATLVATAVVADAAVARKSGTPGNAGFHGVAPLPGYRAMERNTHPLARPENEVGRLDPSRHLSNLSIVFKPTAAQAAERDALVDDIQNPGSPAFHKWLTPEEYAARFGAKPADSAKVVAWLASQGLEVHSVSRLASRVMFSGTVAQIENAFKAEMHQYQHGTEVHFAMATAPQVPADIADMVLSIRNTHDFFAKPASHGKPVPVPETTCTGSYCSGNVLGPVDWANIYDVTPLYTNGPGGKATTGTGITIAIVGESAVALGDINTFRSKYGLTALAQGTTYLTTLVPNTGVATGDFNGSGGEAVLDLEWAGGIAKGATLNYVFTGADLQNVDDAVYYTIENNLAPIISESWGGPEYYYPPSYGDEAEVYGSAAALLGITYLAASGDSGAADAIRNGAGGMYVNLPSGFPTVTGIGGTQFGTGTTSSLTFGTGGLVSAYPTAAGAESVWNESNDPAATNGVGSGGGGISILFPRPAYQANVPQCTPVGTLPGGASPANMRQVPDISFAAASGLPGYVVWCTLDATTGDCKAAAGTAVALQYGGTSASTPAFAGVVALLNQATGGRLGNINPMLYQLQTSNKTAFHDITAGNNEIKCTAGTDPGCGGGGLYGYAAATGYDCASGLGSIDVKNLVTAWAALTPTTTTMVASPTATTEGAQVSLTATVTGTGTIGGHVTFAFESYSANGTLDLSWPIGTATVTGGTGTLSAAIPPGLVNKGAQYVDVVAEYDGDATHLASTSTKSRVTFSSPLAFCVTPGTDSVAAGAAVTFSSQGGNGTTQWVIYNDTTCLADGGGCSSADTAGNTITAGTGQAGWVLIQALDSLGAETYAELTVGSPTGAAPWDGDSGIIANACATTGDAGHTVDASTHVDAAHGGPDAGAQPGVDGGPVVTPGDSGATGSPDATTGGGVDGGGGGGGDAGGGGTHIGNSGGGCSISTAPRSNATPAGLFAGLVLGLGILARRRRSS